MVKRSFVINTEPHVAEVGGKEYKFKPEVSSADLMQAYQGYLDAGGVTDATKVNMDDPEAVLRIVNAAHDFLSYLMEPEEYTKLHEAHFPDRVLGQMIEWIMEVYTDRPTTPPNGSSPQPSAGGRTSRERSLKKAAKTR